VNQQEVVTTYHELSSYKSLMTECVQTLCSAGAQLWHNLSTQSFYRFCPWDLACLSVSGPWHKNNLISYSKQSILWVDFRQVSSPDSRVLTMVLVLFPWMFYYFISTRNCGVLNIISGLPLLHTCILLFLEMWVGKETGLFYSPHSCTCSYRQGLVCLRMSERTTQESKKLEQKNQTVDILEKNRKISTN
jgi:hypothetical protein